MNNSKKKNPIITQNFGYCYLIVINLEYSFDYIDRNTLAKCKSEFETFNEQGKIIFTYGRSKYKEDKYTPERINSYYRTQKIKHIKTKKNLLNMYRPLRIMNGVNSILCENMIKKTFHKYKDECNIKIIKTQELKQQSEFLVGDIDDVCAIFDEACRDYVYNNYSDVETIYHYNTSMYLDTFYYKINYEYYKECESLFHFKPFEPLIEEIGDYFHCVSYKNEEGYETFYDGIVTNIKQCKKGYDTKPIEDKDEDEGEVIDLCSDSDEEDILPSIYVEDTTMSY